MLFINTRPSDRAKSLTQQLQLLGHDVLDLPLLELMPMALTQSLAGQFLTLNQADVIVVVSPTAAEIGLLYLQTLKIPLHTLGSLNWIAVGEKTAQVLAEVGIQAHIPMVENSEGMLQLPILQVESMRTVAFWRGEGGRQFMMEQLIARGIHIVNMLLYQRALPICASDQAQVLSEYLQHYHLNTVFICVSSEASWRNWKNICAQHDLELARFIYLPLGQRLAEVVYDDLANKPATIYPISDLKPATIHTVMLRGQTNQ